MPRPSRRRRRTTAALLTAAGTAAGVLALSAAAVAAPAGGEVARTHAVFVQTNDPAANTVIAYSRDAAGHLHESGRYATGGLGGSVAGAPVDPLASQGGLTYDAAHHLLYAVNAGSGTLTVFAVDGARLHRLQILPTAGRIPVSVAVARDRVYVLNAAGDGSITGFRVRDGRLAPLPHSTRGLGLGNADVPFFLASPSQVALTPDGGAVVVATKNHNLLEVFPLDGAGRPSASPVVTDSAGAVPFALVFDSRGRLLVTEAAGSESSYAVGKDGSLTAVSSAVPDNGQQAACWSVVVGDQVYVANAGSGTITAYRVADDGTLSLKDASGVAATTDAGPIDLAAGSDGRFLYQQANGAGAIDEFAIGADGSLTRIGTVTGLPVFDGGNGPEGIAAT